MGKVVVAQFVTLDGRTEDPDGSAGTSHGGWAFRHPEAVAGDMFRLLVFPVGLGMSAGRTPRAECARIMVSRTR